MKMDFNTGNTWRQVRQWTLMMKIYDFFYSAKLFIVYMPCIGDIKKIIMKMEDFLGIIIQGN